MPAPLNELPGAVPVYAAVPPSINTAPILGDPIDLIDSDGECFAVQHANVIDEGGTWTGRVEQSADLVAWAVIPGAAFEPLSEGASVQAIRFARTARYVRYAAAMTGTPTLLLAALVGQPRKSF